MAQSDGLWADFFQSTWGTSDSLMLIFTFSWRQRFRRKLAGVLVCRECSHGKVGERSAGLLIRSCLCPGLVHLHCLDKLRAHTPLQSFISWLGGRRRADDRGGTQVVIAEDGNPMAVLPLQDDNATDPNNNHDTLTHCHACQFPYFLRCQKTTASWDRMKWAVRMFAEMSFVGLSSALVLAMAGWPSASPRGVKREPSFRLLFCRPNLARGMLRVADVVGVTARVAAIFLGSSDARDVDFYDDHRGLGLFVMSAALYVGVRTSITRHNRYYRQLLVSRMQVCDRGQASYRENQVMKR